MTSLSDLVIYTYKCNIGNTSNLEQIVSGLEVSALLLKTWFIAIYHLKKISHLKGTVGNLKKSSDRRIYLDWSQ